MDTTTIQILCTVIAVVISAISLVRSGKKDTGTEATRQGQMLEKIDQVHRDVKELNKQYIEIAKHNSQSDERFKTLYSDVHNLKERMTAVERNQRGGPA